MSSIECDGDGNKVPFFRGAHEAKKKVDCDSEPLQLAAIQRQNPPKSILCAVRGAKLTFRSAVRKQLQGGLFVLMPLEFLGPKRNVNQIMNTNNSTHKV